MDKKLNVCQQCALAARKPSLQGMHLGLHWQEHRPPVEWSDPSPLFGTSEITSGRMCPMLDCPVLERCCLVERVQWRDTGTPG